MMLRFAAQVFEKSFRPTLGADFMKKNVMIDGVEYTLQLWDTAGLNNVINYHILYC